MKRKPIPPFELNNFSARFRAESDRACAVLGAAMLDARLEKVFQNRLQCLHQELLSNTGPIGTFSARIKIASALAWIDADVQRDLDTIRSIRNEFAHSFDHDLSFADQSIAAKCRNLLAAEALIEEHEIAARKPTKRLAPSVILCMVELFKPPRSRYEVTVEMLAQHLVEIDHLCSDRTPAGYISDVRKLGSNFDFTVNGSGTVSPQQPSTEDEKGNEKLKG